VSKAKRTTVTMAVTMEVPTGANINDLLTFVREALADYGGLQRVPLNEATKSDSPMRELKMDTVKVSLQRRVTEYK